MTVLLETSHRGPDERVYWSQGDLKLGMNRLAIRDLTPRLYPFKYKQFVLIFNGEIYNYSELRKKLENKGILFNSTCDAEIILPLFSMYGAKGLGLLDGMFALSIFDRKTGKIHLARDRYGEKPLYFLKQEGGQFFFSSETRVFGLFSKLELDIDAVSEYARYGFLHNQKTLRKNIYKLEPGEYVICDTKTGQVTTGRYVEFGFHKSLVTKNYAKEFGVLAEKSVQSRLVADTGVGVFLSGGIDSSLLTYYSCKKNKDIISYTATFPEYKDIDESEYAKFVAKKMRINNVVVPCSVDIFSKSLFCILDAIDEPIADPAVIPTFFLAGRAVKDVKVVLTGEGLDELYHGYSSHIDFLRHFSVPGLKSIFSSFYRAHKEGQSIKVMNLLNGVFGQKKFIHGRIFSNEFLITNPSKLDERVGLVNNSIDVTLYEMNSYLSENLFMKLDKIAMFHGLESRAAFMNPGFVNFSLGVPERLKIDKWKGNGKILPKIVASEIFGSEFANRPKKGLSVPLDGWLRNREMRKEVDKIPDYFVVFSKYLSVDNISKFVRQFQSGTGHYQGVWALLVLGYWLNKNRHKIYV